MTRSDSSEEGTVLGNLRRLGTLPPWVEEIARPEHVHAALGERIGELASGALTLRRVESKRLRIKSNAWTVTYELTVEDGDGTPRVLSVRGRVFPPGAPELDEPPSDVPFGEDGWRCAVPELSVLLEMNPPDAALPALPILTDAERARALLERGIRECSPRYPDIRILACRPNVVR